MRLALIRQLLRVGQEVPRRPRSLAKTTLVLVSLMLRDVVGAKQDERVGRARDLGLAIVVERGWGSSVNKARYGTKQGVNAPPYVRCLTELPRDSLDV